jgi:hypothetical protein
VIPSGRGDNVPSVLGIVMAYHDMQKALGVSYGGLSRATKTESGSYISRDSSGLLAVLGIRAYMSDVGGHPSAV